MSLLGTRGGMLQFKETCLSVPLIRAGLVIVHLNC